MPIGLVSLVGNAHPTKRYFIGTIHHKEYWGILCSNNKYFKRNIGYFIKCAKYLY